MITDRYIPDPAEFSGDIDSSDFETNTRMFHTLSDIADRIRADGALIEVAKSKLL